MSKLFELVDSQREIVGGRRLVRIMSIFFIVSVMIAGSAHSSLTVIALGFLPYAACGQP